MMDEMILNEVKDLQDVKFAERTITAESMKDMLASQGWMEV